MNITQSKGFTTLVKTDVLPITKKGIRSISETPYGTPGNALAELIDNSWEKGYGTTRSEIISTYEKTAHGKLKLIKVIDNGPGMDAATIEQCFKIGSETEKGDDTLGLYGIGQKSACLWMGEQYEVLTKRADGPLYSAIYSYDEGLQIGEVKAETVYRMFKNAVKGDHGTMVIISNINTSRFRKRKSSFTEDIKRSHGLIYCNKIKEGCNMFVNGERIQPIDFFNHDISTKLSEDNAVFKFTDSKGNAHDIPYEAWFTPSDKESDKDPRFLSRTIEHQGFVTLRNSRVVGIGQTFDVIGAKNNIYNGLTIILNMDGGLDSYFGISFGKTQRGQVMNDDIREQFRKEFKRYFGLAKKYQNLNHKQGETTEEFDKATLDMQENIAKDREIQNILNGFKCNAEIDGDVDDSTKPKDDKPETPTNPEVKPKQPNENVNKEKKHRKHGKGKICGVNFQWVVEERGDGVPYFVPEVDEKGVCRIVINSSHNYYANHFVHLNRTSIVDAMKLMFADWLAIYGKGYEPDEDTLMTYMRILQDRSDELQKLYKENVEEVFDEFDED